MGKKSDREIIEKFNDCYQEAFDCWNAFFPEASTDLNFVLGSQWSRAEKNSLEQEGRNAYVFNRIKPVINLISGYQRQHRLSSIVVPVEDSDQKTADQLSQVMAHVMSYNNGYNLISECFGGAIKTGWNLASVWMDYREDIVNGDIRFNREPWNSFILDPYFTKLNLSDCSYIMRRKYLPADVVASMLPKKEKDVYLLQKLGNEKDDKFSWMSYQRNDGSDLLAYNEFYLSGWEEEKIIIDMETGIWKKWEAPQEMFDTIKAINPSYELAKRQKRYITRHIIVNEQLMATEKNPDGLDVYPFVPFVGIFEPESEDYSLKIQSIVRAMRDPQREANRRRSQMIDILDSQINSGWIATEGSVINPRSLFQASQGKVIWRSQDAAPGSIEKIQPAQVPPSMFQLQQQFDADIKEIAGVNDAAFGVVESGNESGIMTMLRQGAALTNLQDVFDNLRLSQKQLSMLTLKLIQTWTPQKIQRIINQEPTPEFFNQEFTKYDCAVQEGLLTETQRQTFFRQLLDLKQLGEPLPPMLLAKAAPIQGKSEYYEEMEKFQQQQQQQQQAEAQAQQELLQAQKDLAMSQSLLQVAGAKERFTRSVSNMGLEDERSAAAVRDRTQSALDQVKTIKELEQMDITNAKEEINLAMMLKDLSAVEEEKLKEDNVEISKAASQMPQEPWKSVGQPQQNAESMETLPNQ